MTAESFAHFCCCNFWHQRKSLTIPEAIRHPTRETQEHRVTSTHSAAAPSACGSFCPMCDFLGRMVLLRKRLRSTRQAGRACSASCVLFPYSCKNSFDLMSAERFAHFCWIVCTRPALHLLFLTLETTRTRTRLKHNAQNSTSPALLRLQQQE